MRFCASLSLPQPLYGLGLGDCDLFRVEGLGLRVYGLGFRPLYGLGLGDCDLFRV